MHLTVFEIFGFTVSVVIPANQKQATFGHNTVLFKELLIVFRNTTAVVKIRILSKYKWQIRSQFDDLKLKKNPQCLNDIPAV